MDEQQIRDFFTTYKANKMVAIRSSKLALLHRSVQIAIILYIAVYVILYKNKHLQPVPMDGSVRLTIQQPTQGCNPMKAKCKSDYMPMSSLPYCKQYEGPHDKEGSDPKSFVPWSKARFVNASKLKEDKMQQECVYKDNINMSSAFPVPGTLFLLSRLSELPQYAECTPNQKNKWSCDGALYRMESDRSQHNYYVADIERFTVLLDHSFRAYVGESKLINGDGSEYDGYVQKDCGDMEQIPNKPGANSDYKSLFNIPIGTIISLADLLNIAHPDGEKVLDMPSKHGKTRRWNGGVLHISITYSSDTKGPKNFFGEGSISYVMGVTLLPQAEFKNMHSKVSDGNRAVYDDHGFLIVASVHGTLYVFDFVYLCQVLTTSVAMFAIASVVVDAIMNYFVSHRKHYQTLQYQTTINFDDIEQDGSGILACCDGMAANDRAAKEEERTQRAESAHPLLRFEKDSKKLEGDALLYVLLKFEQRLNSLDGVDTDFVCGAQPKSKRHSEILKTIEEEHNIRFKDGCHRESYVNKFGPNS